MIFVQIVNYICKVEKSEYLALATRVSLLPSAERLIIITSKYIDPAKFLLILILAMVMLTLIDKVDKEEKGEMVGL